MEAPASLLSELKRRRVFRALVGYGIAAFAVLQIIEPVMHGLHWSEDVLSYVVVALAVGFPLVVGLAWIFDVNAGRLERTAPVQPMRARMALVLAGIGLLAAAPGLVYYLVLRRPSPVPPAAQLAQSIAVLPFVNLSSDKEQEYFSDGIAEEILCLLAKVPGLHVAARTSAFSFKGKSVRVDEIGRELGVASVLEGSVRKAGDRIRITAELVNAVDGYHLWSETYDRKLTDIFVVQDEIGQAVVAALKLKLLQAPNSRERRTSNAQAYNQYLLGRQFFNRTTLDGYRRAAQAYEKAIALDPGFALGWAGLALATYWIADQGEAAAVISEGQQRALAAADKAVAFGPDLAEAYVARGVIRSSTQWDWKGAQADFERATALNPENADIHRDYSRYVLVPLGRLSESIAAVRKSTELDPLNGRAWTSFGYQLLAAGKRNEARDALTRALEVNPEDAFAIGWLGILELLEERPAEALQIFERQPVESFRLASTAFAYHVLGKRNESDQALQKLIGKYGHSSAYQIAMVYAWRGNKDHAFEWLERARVQGDGGLTLLKTDPLLRNLRGDPRYGAFLAKMNLPPR